MSVFKGQTANIQSVMVTEALASIERLQRTSTANPKIIGYTQSETGSAIQELLLGNVDAAGCVKLMDDYILCESLSCVHIPAVPLIAHGSRDA